MAVSAIRRSLALAPGSMPTSAGSSGVLLKAFPNSLRGARAVKQQLDDWRILAMGDSLSLGANQGGYTGSNADLYTGCRNGNWQFHAAAKLATLTGLSVSADAWFGDGYCTQIAAAGTNVALIDSRLTFSGADWQAGTNVNNKCIGGVAITNTVSASTSTFTYAPTLSCNRVTIFFQAQISSQGKFTYSIDGGAATTVNTNIGISNGCVKAIDISLGSSTTHTITIGVDATSTGSIFIHGMMPYDTNTRRIIIIHAGAQLWGSVDWTSPGNGAQNWWPGATTSASLGASLPMWLQNATGPNYSRIGQHTTIWFHAPNDYKQGSTIPQQKMRDNDASVFRHLRENGSDVVKVFPHATAPAGFSGLAPDGITTITGDSTTEPVILQYLATSQQQAANMQVPHCNNRAYPLDTWAKFYPTNNESTNFHLVSAGYRDVYAARIVSDILSPVWMAA